MSQTVLPGKTVKDPGASGTLYVKFISAFKTNTDIAQIRLSVDPSNELTEVNEENNVAASRTLPYGQRDLALQNLTLASGDVSGFTVANIGSYSVRSFTIGMAWLDVSGNQINPDNGSYRLLLPVIKSLKPAASTVFPANKSQNQKIVSFLGKMPPGAMKLKVWVDVASTFTDPTPENNVGAVERPVDLQAESIDLTKQESITFSIKNAGKFSVKGYAYRVEVLGADGQILTSFAKTTSKALAAGKTVVLPEATGKSWSAFLAEYKKHPEARTLRLTVDPDNAFLEREERNNEVTMSYLGYGARDLQVTNVKYVAEVPWLDVRNNGNHTIKGFTWKLEWVDKSGTVLNPELFVEFDYSKSNLLAGKYMRFSLPSFIKGQAKVFLNEKPALAEGFKATVSLASSKEHDIDLANNTQTVIVPVIK